MLRALPKAFAAECSGCAYVFVKAAMRRQQRLQPHDPPHEHHCLRPAAASACAARQSAPRGGEVRRQQRAPYYHRSGREVAGLCTEAAGPGVGQMLAPLQLRVGLHCGDLCMGHAVRTQLASGPDMVLLKLNWRDAVDTVSLVSQSHDISDVLR